MAVGSIVISNNVLDTGVSFDDTLVVGSPTQWKENSYKHQVKAMGGFHSAKFSLLSTGSGGIEYLYDYLLNGLTRDVKVFAIDGTQIWEGLIGAMVLNLPGASLTVNIDKLGNRVWVRYLSAEGGLIRRATKANDTESQSRFGIKEVVLQGAIISDTNIADQIAETYLAKYKEPRQPNVRLSGNIRALSAGISLDVFCRGYFRTLNWQTYNQVATQGAQNASLQIADIVAASGQFVSSQDIATNTSQANQVYDSDELAGDSILNIARLADSNNKRYIVGMYEDRTLRYEQVIDISTTPVNIKHGVRIRDNELEIFNLGDNATVNPAKLRPNNWITVEDIFPMNIPESADKSQDPRNTYIEIADYFEPIGFDIKNDPASDIKSQLALAGFGGVSQI